MIHESAAQRKTGRLRAPSCVSPGFQKSGERESSGANAVRQRAGNEGIQRMMSEMSGARIQAKLTVSQPGDAHEQQADRVANAVMAAPSPGMQEMPTASTHAVQRRCADCDEEMGKKPGAQVQRMEQGAGAAPPVTPAVAANLHAMRGGGSVLPADTRAFSSPGLTPTSARCAYTRARRRRRRHSRSVPRHSRWGATLVSPRDSTLRSRAKGAPCWRTN